MRKPSRSPTVPASSNRAAEKSAEIGGKKVWLWAMLLLGITFAAYFPVWHGKPIWDDDAHLTRRDLQSVQGLIRIWIEPTATQQYYPLTHSAFWLQQKFWGDSTLGYHLTNIFIHCLSALLLVRILRRLQVPGAWLAAALFALHPVEVESVAWITELKNTLSGVFYLSAALLYLKFDETRARKYYVLTLVLFVLGLFCKTVIASLPAALLIVFWWKRGVLSWRKDVVPLLPFFVVGLVMGLATAVVERELIGARGAEFNFTLLERCLIAGRAFWFYLGKLFWPAPLIFIYPRWKISSAVWWQYLFPAAALLLVAILWSLRRRWRGPLAAVLFFGGTLFPALGFANVYPFRYSFVADHFQYLASLGIIVFFAALVAGWFGRKTAELRMAGLPGAVALLAVLACLTFRQSEIYRDVDSLWGDTLKKDPGSFLAHNNIGSQLLQNGDFAAAEEHFRAALATRPDYDEAIANLGLVRSRQGNDEEGMTLLREALKLTPNKVQFRIDLGYLLAQVNRLEEAKAEFLEVLKIKPGYVQAHLALARLLMQMGDGPGAVREQKEALRLTGDIAPADAHGSLAELLFQLQEFKEAAENATAAVKAAPNDAKNHVLLGLCQTKLKDYPAAIASLHEALRLSPDNPIAMDELAVAYAELGRFKEAVETAERTRSIFLQSGKTELAQKTEERLSFYRAGKPWREP